MRCIFLLAVLAFQFNTLRVEAFAPHRQPFSPEGSEYIEIPAMPPADGTNLGAERMQPQNPDTTVGTIVLVSIFSLSLLLLLSCLYILFRLKKCIWLGFVVMVFPLLIPFVVFVFLDGVMQIVADYNYSEPIVWFCDMLFRYTILFWVGGFGLIIYGITQHLKKKKTVV